MSENKTILFVGDHCSVQKYIKGNHFIYFWKYGTTVYLAHSRDASHSKNREQESEKSRYGIYISSPPFI